MMQTTEFRSLQECVTIYQKNIKEKKLCYHKTQCNTAGINHDGRRRNSPEGCVTMPPGVPEPRQPLYVTNCTKKKNTFFLTISKWYQIIILSNLSE